MTPTPILVRHYHDLCVPPGARLGTMSPYVLIPNQKMAKANLVQPDKHDRRVLIGTAAGTEVRYYNPSGSDDTLVTRQATYYIVRDANDELVATACTKREAWEVFKEATSGPAPKILLVNAFRGIESDDYVEIPVYPVDERCTL